MFFNVDWRSLLKAILKAALPFFIGGAIGVTASGSSSLQTPRAKAQTSAIYAFGLPAIVVTHNATQNADYSGTILTRQCRVGDMGSGKREER